MSNSSLEVFVIDDHADQRARLCHFLSESGKNVVPFASGQEFLKFWQADPVPGVVVVSSDLSDIPSLDLQRSLLELKRPFSTIFISECAEVPICVQAIKLGAIDFIEHPVGNFQLLTAVQEAESRLAQQNQAHQQREAQLLLYRTLTRREAQVFELAARGILNKRIAVRLGIAEKTVKIHRGRVMSKLRLSSIAELVKFFMCLNPALQFPDDLEQGNPTRLTIVTDSDASTIDEEPLAGA